MWAVSTKTDGVAAEPGKTRRQRWAPSCMKYLHSSLEYGLLRASWKNIITVFPPSSSVFCVVKFYDGNFKRQWSRGFPKMLVLSKQYLTYVWWNKMINEFASRSPARRHPIRGELCFCQTTEWNLWSFESSHRTEGRGPREPAERESPGKPSLTDSVLLNTEPHGWF